MKAVDTLRMATIMTMTIRMIMVMIKAMIKAMGTVTNIRTGPADA